MLRLFCSSTELSLSIWTRAPLSNGKSSDGVFCVDEDARAQRGLRRERTLADSSTSFTALLVPVAPLERFHQRVVLCIARKTSCNSDSPQCALQRCNCNRQHGRRPVGVAATWAHQFVPSCQLPRGASPDQYLLAPQVSSSSLMNHKGVGGYGRMYLCR